MAAASDPATIDRPAMATPRVVLVTGKGGVGKTTVAGATAVHAASLGHRVLVTSTDPAHSLADLFDTPLGDAPTDVDTRLQAVQLDGHQRLQHHWADVRDWLVDVLVAGGTDRLQAAELVMLPGMDELFALLDVQAHVDDGAHDVVVVDCAPTAETLRLLALPEALGFYSDRLLGPGRRLARLVRPLSQSVAGVPLPRDEVFTTVDRVQERLVRAHHLLTDPARTSVRLVVTPQRMVVAESRRTATALSLFGHAIDMVVANRVLEVQAPDTSWARAHHNQQQVLDDIDESFGAWDVRRAPWLADEPIGVPALGRFGASLYDDVDPVARHRDVPGIRVDDTSGGEVVVTVPLPFADRDGLDLHRRGAQVHVRVGPVKRVLTLPDSLATHEVAGAGISDGQLRLVLRDPDVRTTPVEVAS